MPETKSLQQWARDSVVLVLAEFAIVAGLFVADVYHPIFFSKTPYLFFLAWVSLRLRGMRWKEIGFEELGKGVRRWNCHWFAGCRMFRFVKRASLAFYAIRTVT
jgi:hypothetical protein